MRAARKAERQTGGADVFRGRNTALEQQLLAVKSSIEEFLSRDGDMWGLPPMPDAVLRMVRTSSPSLDAKKGEAPGGAPDSAPDGGRKHAVQARPRLGRRRVRHVSTGVFVSGFQASRISLSTILGAASDHGFRESWDFTGTDFTCTYM